MNTVTVNGRANEMPLSELPYGSLFRWPSSTEVYIKTDERGCNNTSMRKVVHLATGVAYSVLMDKVAVPYTTGTVVTVTQG